MFFFMDDTWSFGNIDHQIRIMTNNLMNADEMGEKLQKLLVILNEEMDNILKDPIGYNKGESLTTSLRTELESTVNRSLQRHIPDCEKICFDDCLCWFNCHNHLRNHILEYLEKPYIEIAKKFLIRDNSTRYRN